jgi:excisionase family DNA binding protein
MRVTELAAILGVHRTTVTGWIKKGLIPATRTPGGKHIIGSLEQLQARQAPITNNATLYIYFPLPEVIDTEAEIAKLKAFAAANEFTVDQTIIEGSYEDRYLRKQLLKLLSQPTLRTIITNRQSLPDGWKFMSTALAASGRRFIVADAEKHHERQYRYQSHQTR